jgi:23S rRNA (guanine745-N1)-methyltransferase
MIWQCPVCDKALVLGDVSCHCENGHSFDRAKQGYYNLLLANQKRSADPGDSKSMMECRRAFLKADFYQPLLVLLQKHLKKFSASISTPKILDCGCGEGYYLEGLQRAEPAVHAYGIDISKEAIKLAARSKKQRLESSHVSHSSIDYAVDYEIDYVVASNFHLPIRSGSLDLVFKIFAPSDDSGVLRVLNSTGEFWRVSPGPNHLHELKSHLYERNQPHELPKPPESMELLERESLTFEMALPDQASIQQLLGMTPFVWQAPKRKQELAQQLDSLVVTADFIFERFGRANDDVRGKETHE